MHVFKTTLAVALVFGLAAAASAQSLGELAAQEKQKRQGKPAPKTITESDLAKAGQKGTLSMSGSPEAPAEAPADGSAPAAEAPAPEAAPPAEGAAEAPPEGTPPPEQKPAEPAKPKGPPPKTAEESHAEEKAKLQKKLDAARTDLTKHQEMLDKIGAALAEGIGSYSQARADLFKRQDVEKEAVAKAQAEVAQLEEQIRRSAWPR